MIITCPNCQSRYEVAAQALGERGRKVECASCHANWKALPLPETDMPPADRMFSAEEEKALDADFEREEAAATAKAGAKTSDPLGKVSSIAGNAEDETTPEDKARIERQRKALEIRQQVLKRNLPQARMRRAWRMILAVVLMTLIGGGIYLREPIVRAIPDMAGLYSAVGLGVNVVGLEFSEVKTLRAMRDGAEVLQISANLVNVAGRQVAVPPVVVSLLDENDNLLFEWSVVPQVQVLQANDWTGFSTQLTSPPAGAADLNLSFLEHASGNSR